MSFIVLDMRCAPSIVVPVGDDNGAVRAHKDRKEAEQAAQERGLLVGEYVIVRRKENRDWVSVL